MTYRSPIFFSLVCFFHSELMAQPGISDSILVNRMHEALTNRYYQSIKENAPFLSGVEYTGHGQGLIGHAFFDTENSYTGWLEYDGVIYKNIIMQYDLVEDAIIVKDFTQNYFIKLNSQKISSFSLGKNVFAQPAFQQKDEKVPWEGFFQQLYNGSTTALVKRRKQVVYSATIEKLIGRYFQYNSYYIKRGADYYPITRTKDILKVYSDKKNEIRKFIMDKKLSFRSQPEEMIAQIAAYYEQTKK